MKRKLHFLMMFLLMIGGVTSAWAETVTINPSKERCDRTNNATPTAWNSGFPKIATASGNTQMEVKNLDARIWVLEQFEIPNIERVKSITLTYTRVSGQTNNGSLAIWNFPFTYPADDAGFSGEPRWSRFHAAHRPGNSRSVRTGPCAGRRESCCAPESARWT